MEGTVGLQIKTKHTLNYEMYQRGKKNQQLGKADSFTWILRTRCRILGNAGAEKKCFSRWPVSCEGKVVSVPGQGRCLSCSWPLIPSWRLIWSGEGKEGTQQSPSPISLLCLIKEPPHCTCFHDVQQEKRKETANPKSGRYTSCRHIMHRP